MNESERVYEAFERELGRVARLARYKAQRAHVEDVEGVLAEWKVRCWRVYPRLARESEEDARNGRRCRHNVPAYMTRMMGNLLRDVHRRGVVRGHVARSDGETDWRTEHPDSTEVSGVAMDDGVRLGMDGVIDDGAADPAEVAEANEERRVLRRCLAGLEREERESVEGWMAERRDAEVAAEKGVSASTVWRRRERTLERLRELFREAGWEISREAARQKRRRGRREKRERFGRDNDGDTTVAGSGRSGNDGRPGGGRGGRGARAGGGRGRGRGLEEGDAGWESGA